MSDQLALNLEQTIRYSAGHFVLHSGVAKLASDIDTIVGRHTFSLVYVVGEPRAGKTHLAAYLEARLSLRGQRARIARGTDLEEWFREQLSGKPLTEGEVIIIDDGDIFLAQSTESGTAGIFMDIVERARRVKGAVVVLGAVEPDQLSVNPQIRSRLTAGLYLRIGNPTEPELDELLDVITKQRGILLTEAKRNYVLRRVPRDISGLVDCIERLREQGEWSQSTAFHVLAEAVTSNPE